MKKLLLIILPCTIMALHGHTQNDPLYAQYLNNPLVINPAYTGLNNTLNTSLSYRNQWANFDGGASTVNISAHTSLHDNKMGLGVLLVQDKIGSTKNTEAYATYSYKLDLHGKQLSFGLQGGFMNFKSNDDELNPYDQNDLLFSGHQNYTKLSLGAGIIVKTNRYFLGLSMPRMLRESVRIDGNTVNLTNRHVYIMAAYMIPLSSHVDFKPSILVKSVTGAPLSVDINTSFVLNQKYSIGLYTRNLNAYGTLVQIRFADAYRFGYAYEIPTNHSVGTRFTTQEISLGLNLSLFSFHDSSVSPF